MNELPGNDSSHVYNRAFLLHGPKRNAVLSLAEIQQYGLDSFASGLHQYLRYGAPRMVPPRRSPARSHGRRVYL
jgi:hypothetical protein